jgi:fluoroquinolone transport system ATP-binding protein
MIEVEALRFQYPGAPAPAVRDVSFTVPAGRVFGFLGPSGAGKSTVQKVMTGLLPQQHGEVRYGGRPRASRGRELFHEVGMSFEHPNLFPRLSARENLRVFAGLYGRGHAQIDPLLERLGLAAARDRHAQDFSKGMRQRLVLARALLHAPRYLFLDEPTSGLDPALVRDVIELLREHRERGAAIVLTTHDMHVASVLSDEVAFLHGGRIVAAAPPRALEQRHGRPGLTVQWRDGETLRTEVLAPDAEPDRARLVTLLASGSVQTVHSREATLEQIFVELTGQELRG